MSFFTSHVCHSINKLTIDVYIVHFESKQLNLIYERLKKILDNYAISHEHYILHKFLHVTFFRDERNSTLFEYVDICDKMKKFHDEYENCLNLYIRFPFSKLPRFVHEYLEKKNMNHWHIELEITKNNEIKTYEIEIYSKKHQFATLVMNHEYMSKMIMKDAFD